MITPSVENPFDLLSETKTHGKCLACNSTKQEDECASCPFR